MSKMFSKIFCCLILLALPLPAVQAATETLHHDLEISLFPSEKRLAGIDRLRVKPDGASSFLLNLSKKTSVVGVDVNGAPAPFEFQDGQLRVPLRSNQRQGIISLAIRYEGIFDDPIPDAPLNTDDPSYGITGTISERGAFLQAGAGWYPEIPGSRPTYRLRVDAPEGVLAVSEGKCLGHETKQGRTWSVWEVRHPVEGLSLSAARYVVQEKDVGKVRAATYFFPGSEHLASGYLAHTARYITLYEKLFGPYPFDKFAVVENFFPTGYGFPSYTLLGSRVIRLPFIIHTSLGHEIAHCWWGNGVYTDYETGNWSEALTTYVADYLYKERASVEGARDYRLQALRKFSTLVSPQKDFPLKHFRTRYDPASQAIGYGKGMMVFHMIRRLVGDEAFWGALREIYRERLFKRTSWEHFQRAFERRGHRSLQGFFDQWLSRKGAPHLSLENVRSSAKDGTWQVRGQIVQREPFYRLHLSLTLKGGRMKVTEKIRVSGRKTPFQISFDWPPERLALDPNFDTFRQLYPSEIPPSVDAIKGSPSVLVVTAKNALPGIEDTVKTLTLSLGLKNFSVVSEDQLQENTNLDRDMIIVGLPHRAHLLSNLPAQLTVQKKGFTLNGRPYSHPSAVLFSVFAHPSVDGRVTALFLPLSIEYANTAASKVAHYGKYSYLVFGRGRAPYKGIWPISASPLIYEWERQ